MKNYNNNTANTTDATPPHPSSAVPTYTAPRPIFMPDSVRSTNSRYEVSDSQLDQAMKELKPVPRDLPPLENPDTYAEAAKVTPELTKYIDGLSLHVEQRPELNFPPIRKPKLRMNTAVKENLPMPHRLTALQLQRFLALRAVNPSVWTAERLAKGFELSVQQAEELIEALAAPILTKAGDDTTLIGKYSQDEIPAGFNIPTTIQGIQSLMKHRQLIEKQLKEMDEEKK